MTKPWPRNKRDFTFPRVILLIPCPAWNSPQPSLQVKLAKPVERQRAVCCCCSFADDVTKTYILALLEQLRDGGIFALKQHTHVLSLLFHIYWSLISTSSKVSCHMIASVKTECVAVLTNLRWHCGHGHTTMTSQRVGVHSFESRPNEAVIWGSLFGETITRTNTQAWPHVWIVWLCVHWHCIGLVSNHWSPLLR